MLDGLDECDTTSVEALLGLIQDDRLTGSLSGNRSSLTPSACSIKWLVASRREDIILEQLGGNAQIDLEQNSQHVTLAVEEYVRVQTSILARKKKYDQNLEIAVRRTLLEKAEGTFLWVSLACAQLARPGVKSLHTIRLLSNLPTGLTPLYQQILDDIFKRTEEVAEDDRDYVTSILRAMSLAFRPLSVIEIGAVADLPDKYRESLSIMEDFVRLCGALVEIRQDRVHFVHASVKAFLSTVGGILSPNSDTDHVWMAGNCFYSLFNTFKEYQKQIPSSSERTKGRPLPAFVDYAAVFWNRHAQAAPMDHFLQLHGGEQLWNMRSDFRNCWFNYHWKASHFSWDSTPQEMSALLVAAYACLPALTEITISRDDPAVINDVDERGHTALMWSAKGRDCRTTSLLLGNGADVNARNSNRESALHLAAFNGDSNFAGHLIAGGLS